MPAAALAVATGAFLLFLVQPLAGKAILPWFGGSAAVWTTAMLLFQALLLLGYLAAHLLVTRVAPRRQPAVHLALAGAVLAHLVARGLTVAPDPSWAPGPGDSPVLCVLGALSTSVGPAFLLLAMTSPLVQAWAARTGVDPARAWQLPAVSNAASLAALLAYPFAMAPALDLPAQARGWALGLVVAVAALARVGWRVRASAGAPAAPDPVAAGPEPDLAARALWVALPAAGTALLLAVTAHVCEDVAVVATLWVVPLAIYLLSWVVAFAGPRAYRRQVVWPALGLLLLGSAFTVGARADVVSLATRVAVALGALGAGCLALHGEVARLRPGDPARATGYWLSTSAGGALGGALVALGAPALFATRLELPLLLAGLPLLLGACAAREAPGRRARTWLLLGATGLAGLAGAGLARPELAARRDALVLVRNFYGTLRVDDRWLDPTRRVRLLTHGGTLHGAEVAQGPGAGQPIVYYGPTSGVGRALLARTSAGAGGLRLGVVGLGVGALAAYARPGDALRFYELDPDVEGLARGAFSFLPRRPSATVALGDARRALEQEPPQGFDLLVVDAFSGDAVPAHLLTLEAFAVYLRHLAPGGLLALHLTNRTLDLTRVVGPAAARLGLASRLVEDPARLEALIYRSRWALLATDPAALAGLDGPALDPNGRPWTDAWSDLLGIVR